VPSGQTGCSQPNVDEPISLGAFGSCRVEVTYQFTDLPGQYDGTLRFATQDTEAVDFATTLQVRLNVWTAGALILIGLLLGLLLHDVLKKRRLAQRLELDVAWVAQQLGNEVALVPGGLLDQQEIDLVAGMRRVLATIRLSESDDDARRTELASRLKASNKMIDSLRQWVLVRRAALENGAAQGTASAELEAIAVTMTSQNTDDAAAGAVAGRIETVRTGLHGRQVQVVKDEIIAVTSQLESLLDAGLRARVTPLLAEASSVVEESLIDARATLDLARLELVDAYLDLVQTIIGQGATEVGLPSAAWRRLTAGVRAKLVRLERRLPVNRSTRPGRQVRLC